MKGSEDMYKVTIEKDGKVVHIEDMQRNIRVMRVLADVVCC